jgi:hypothetical protein
VRDPRDNSRGDVKLRRRRGSRRDDLFRGRLGLRRGTEPPDREEDARPRGCVQLDNRCLLRLHDHRLRGLDHLLLLQEGRQSALGGRSFGLLRGRGRGGMNKSREVALRAEAGADLRQRRERLAAAGDDLGGRLDPPIFGETEVNLLDPAVVLEGLLVGLRDGLVERQGRCEPRRRERVVEDGRGLWGRLRGHGCRGRGRCLELGQEQGAALGCHAT